MHQEDILAVLQEEEEEGSVLNQGPPSGSQEKLFPLAALKSIWGRDKQMVTCGMYKCLFWAFA